MPSSETLRRASAGIALTVGVAAAMSPRTLVRAYGVPADQMTGAGAFGWRLFAMRNLWVGTRALTGDKGARDMVLPIQFLDQAVFAHAYRTGAVPKPAAVGAMMTSAAIVAMEVAARVR